jgi:hypothetical protein
MGWQVFWERPPSLSLCDENFFEKKSGSIGKSEIIRNGLKIAMDFLLLYRNGFEQKRFSSHIHCDLNRLPMAGGNLGPFHHELTTLFQVSQQPSRQLHIIQKLAVDACEALLLGINPDLTGHLVTEAEN